MRIIQVIWRGPARADMWLVDGQTSSGRTAFLNSGTRIALCAGWRDGGRKRDAEKLCVLGNNEPWRRSAAARRTLLTMDHHRPHHYSLQPTDSTGWPLSSSAVFSNDLRTR